MLIYGVNQSRETLAAGEQMSPTNNNPKQGGIRPSLQVAMPDSLKVWKPTYRY